MARRFKNPMPSRGATLITNGGRRNRHSRRSKKSSVDFSRVIARLKNRRPARAGKKRRSAHRSAKGRFTRKRNGLALRANRGRGRKHRNLKRNRKGRKHSRRNPLAIRANRGHRKRNGLALRANRGHKRGRKHNRKRNGLAIRNNKRRSKYRGGRWASTAYKKRHSNRKRNSSYIVRNRHHRNRRNGLAIRNPMGGIFAKATSLVRKIPIVGKYIAPIAIPALGAALIVGAIHFALSMGVPYLPVMVAGYIAPIGYTLGGAALGLLIHFIPKSILSPASKTAIAGLAIAGGGAVDGIRYLTSTGSATAGFGDGGYWQLGADDGSDPDCSAIRQMYNDASLLDASTCGSDLNASEGDAALRGPRAWASRFPMAQRMTRTQGGTSPHSGQEGHRWGWIINGLGWPAFSQIASMPPGQRLAVIKKIRADAVSTIQKAQATGSYGALVFAQ